MPAVKCLRDDFTAVLLVTVSINRHNRRFEVTHSFREHRIPPMHVVCSTMRKQFTEQVHRALADYEERV